MVRSVRRSYEEFKLIDKYVRLQPGFEILPELPEISSVLGFLPGKQQKRISAVNNWLAALLQIDDLVRIPALRLFLNMTPSNNKFRSFKRIIGSASTSLAESRTSSVCSENSERSNDSTVSNSSDLTVATLPIHNYASNWERVVQYSGDERLFKYDRSLFESAVFSRMFPLSN
jgi:hypothetical protein